MEKPDFKGIFKRHDHPVISGRILPRRIKNESKNIKRCIFVSRFQIYFSFFGETTREKVLLFKTTFY